MAQGGDDEGVISKSRAHLRSEPAALLRLFCHGLACSSFRVLAVPVPVDW